MLQVSSEPVTKNNIELQQFLANGPQTDDTHKKNFKNPSIHSNWVLESFINPSICGPNSRGLSIWVKAYPIYGKCLKSTRLGTGGLYVTLLRWLIINILTRRARWCGWLIRSGCIARRSLSKSCCSMITTYYWHHCILYCHSCNDILEII